MGRTVTALLAGLVLVLAGCPDDGGRGDDRGPDALDAGADAPPDAGPDAPPDAGADAPGDAADVPADGGADVRPDAPPDTPPADAPDADAPPADTPPADAPDAVPADLPDAPDPCPTDFMAADGTPCAPEGRQCGGNCTDRCRFCNLLLCEGGAWRWMEVFPDPACQDAGPDEAGDAAGDDTGDAPPDAPADLPGDAPADAADGGLPDAPDPCTGDACPDPCPGILAGYEQRVQDASACGVDGDCQVLSGHCGVGLGGCWYAVNLSLSQADLDALSQPWVALSCTSGSICRCPPVPGKVACVDGACAAAP